MTQQIADLRLRRGVKPQAVREYDKAKQRRIKGGVSGSNNKAAIMQKPKRAWLSLMH